MSITNSRTEELKSKRDENLEKIKKFLEDDLKIKKKGKALEAYWDKD